MAVIIQRQTEMAVALCTVIGLLHGSEHHCIYHILITFAFYAFEDFIEGPRMYGPRHSFHTEPEPSQESTELLHLPESRRFMDTIDKGHFHPEKMLCHSLIGKKHKFFDQLVGGTPFGDIHAYRGS